jgi:hypothetical protein
LLGLEFVPLRFGERIKESGGTAPDHCWPDIVQRIRIEIGGSGLLAVDRAESIRLAVFRALATDAEHGRCKADRRKDSERFQGTPAKMEGD